MDKNAKDSMTLWMIFIAIVAVLGIGLHLIIFVHEMSYNMGVLTEKVGTLEEMVPIRARK